jgi:hypothetical protein
MRSWQRSSRTVTSTLLPWGCAAAAGQPPAQPMSPTSPRSLTSAAGRGVLVQRRHHRQLGDTARHQRGRVARSPAFRTVLPGSVRECRPTRGELLEGESIYFDLATLCEQAGLPLDELRTAARAGRDDDLTVPASSLPRGHSAWPPRHSDSSDTRLRHSGGASAARVVADSLHQGRAGARGGVSVGQ